MGGPTQRIASALMQLVAATRRPSWADDEMARTYFDTLQEAMHDYPIDVVEDACAAWRRSENGEWWPAEKELRRECDKLFNSRRTLRVRAMEMLSDLEREEEAAERARKPSPFAGDACMTFKNEMRKRMSPARFAAYFHSSEIMFGADEVWVRSPVTESVFKREGGDLLKGLKIRLRLAPVQFQHVKTPDPDEDTPEERAEVKRKFAALMERMKTGQPIRV